MAGQVLVRAGLVCGAAAAGREDAGGRLCRDKRGVLVLVHNNPLEQGAVQDAAFRRFALAVEVAEIGEDADDLVEASTGAGVGGREAVEPVRGRVEARADAILFALEQVQRDRVGIVGLDELEPFSFELVALVGQQDAFVVAGGFELVEHLMQHRPDVRCLILGEPVAAVCGFDAFFEAAGQNRGAGAAVLLPTPASAREVLVAVTLLVPRPFDHEFGAA
ncbi:hypothetical protein [Microbacterium sp. AR7-10]|uniref:hypothetical protein n=1 Tax=Microbacterium sp. AR7-10 TaxID=1891970 RepID=UPI000921FC1B|nr:hypothetical protein [Microbacterium sp. AR7-10]OIU84556.1 hypothetical protein BFN01_13670 [Microbacterium sp. AR7-10]